jgi:hypothetical protein
VGTLILTLPLTLTLTLTLPLQANKARFDQHKWEQIEAHRLALLAASSSVDGDGAGADLFIDKDPLDGLDKADLNCKCLPLRVIVCVWWGQHARIATPPSLTFSPCSNLSHTHSLLHTSARARALSTPPPPSPPPFLFYRSILLWWHLLLSLAKGTTITMRAGDRLYLPFGVLHRAVAGDAGSAHFTVELGTVRIFPTGICTRGCHRFPRLLARTRVSTVLPVHNVNCVQNLKASKD